MASEVPAQPHNLPLVATTEMCSGGTYIVTGANTGLGLEAAKHLVALGAAKVIMGVRNTSAGEKAKTEIEAATETTNITEVWALDLVSYDSVKAFAKKAISELERIDALIENAAVATSERTLFEGHVSPVTVNVLSTLLLAVLLLPKMSESARQFGISPHLAIVTSRVSFDAQEGWNKIQDDPIVKMDGDETIGMQTYPLTKLMEILSIHHLAALLPVSRTGVILNLVCPGFCKTTLSRNAPPEFRKDIAIRLEKFGRTAEDGSRTLLHGAVAGEQSHGRLLADCKILDDAKVPNWVKGEEGAQMQKRIWELVASELESAEPGCVKRLF